jgi:hypothetical protein
LKTSENNLFGEINIITFNKTSLIFKNWIQSNILSANNIIDEHGAVLETWLGKEVPATLRTVVPLHKGFVKREGAGWEKFSAAAGWAFQAEERRKEGRHKRVVFELVWGNVERLMKLILSPDSFSKSGWRHWAPERRCKERIIKGNGRG